jgi:hypothetical protein
MGAGFWSDWLFVTMTLAAAVVLFQQLAAALHRGLRGDPLRFGLKGILATTTAVCVLLAAAASRAYAGLLGLLTIPFVLLLMVGLVSYVFGRGEEETPPDDDGSP